MQHLAMLVGQRVILGIVPTDDQQDPATVENIVWASSADGLVSVTPELPSFATATVRSLAVGSARVIVTANAVGDPTVLRDEWEITVTPRLAVVLNLQQIGAIEDDD